MSHFPPTTTESPVEATPRLLPPYRVVLENDDCHSFHFVVMVLRKALGLGEESAGRLALAAHREGQAIVWTGPKEVAELKLEQLLIFRETLPGGGALGGLSCRIEPAV